MRETQKKSDQSRNSAHEKSCYTRRHFEIYFYEPSSGNIMKIAEGLSI